MLNGHFSEWKIFINDVPQVLVSILIGELMKKLNSETCNDG